MPILPTAYHGSPTHPNTLLPLRPAIPDETTDALCRIVVKVLATFSATSETWVAWGPASPLETSLRVLGLTAQADTTWHWLINRGWVTKRYIYDSFSFRLTPLGTHFAQTPPPPLPAAPAWYLAVLKHLYPPTPP